MIERPGPSQVDDKTRLLRNIAIVDEQQVLLTLTQL